MSALGFGGRAYRADGLEIYVEPLRKEKADGSVGYELGFPFAVLSEYMGDENDIPDELAKYLSCPVRNAAPALLEALEAVVATSPIEDSVLPKVIAAINAAKPRSEAAAVGGR